MPLPLPGGEKIVVPAVAQVEATSRWITQIVIRCPGPTYEGMITLEYVPMTSDGRLLARGPAGEDLGRSLTLQDMYACCKKKPQVKAALDAMLAAIPAAEEYLVEQEAERKAAEESARLPQPAAA